MAIAFVALPGLAVCQDTAAVQVRDDSVSIRLVEADLKAAIQALGTLLDKPVLIGEVTSSRITFATPKPVPRRQIPGLLRGLVETHGLEWVEDSLFYRVVVALPPPDAAAVAGRDTASALHLFVIRLTHARAADVAATVNRLFGGSGEFAGPDALSTRTLSDELRERRLPPPDGDAGRRATEGRVAELTGSVTLVPDAITNSLLIRSTEEDLAVIRDAVAQLDVRPLQVLIEILIVEVRKDRTFSFGASFDWQREDGDETYSAGVGSVLAGGIVVQFMRMARSEVSAVISAAQSRGDVNIVSRPVVLASNNTESSLLVGSQRPFVQVSRSLPTDVPSRDQVVQYRDVGTKLTVRPVVNEDGYVSLDLQQEISSATDESQFGAPVISTREVQAHVLVRDGQTIVLGGLRDHQRDRTRSGVPLLSSLPLIGGLFGSSRSRDFETELFLFLTPTIIRNDEDVDKVTKPKLPQFDKKPDLN